MRIVSGVWRGRKLYSPSGNKVRPTSDRVREAWMSIVGGRIEDALVLDLCAGSGALGLEALSRGAAEVVFVEIDGSSIRALEKNIDMLDASDRCTVIRMDAVRYVQGLAEDAVDVAFADPPYAHETAERIANSWLETPFASLLGVEHSAKQILAGSSDVRRYGDTAVTFFQ